MNAPDRQTVREVTQRFLANDPTGVPGDCVRAAVASLLDREPTSVPHFIAGSDIDSRVWWYALKGWAADNGWTVTRRGLLPRQENVPLPEFGIACGPSERGVSHAVVAVGGQIVWDPHPSRAGILRVKEVIEFTRTVSLPDERDTQLADLATELDAANANAAEIADQRTAYREEVMRLRARVRELEGAQAADDTTRVDALRHTDDTPDAERLAQIRDRNRRLAAVPFETHGGGHGPGCIPCELVRAVDDVRWLLERQSIAAGLREEWGYRWGLGEHGERAEGYDTEADARIGAHHSDTVMRRYVTDWQDVAKDIAEDGERG